MVENLNISETDYVNNEYQVETSPEKKLVNLEVKTKKRAKKLDYTTNLKRKLFPKLFRKNQNSKSHLAWEKDKKKRKRAAAKKNKAYEQFVKNRELAKYDH